MAKKYYRFNCQTVTTLGGQHVGNVFSNIQECEDPNAQEPKPKPKPTIKEKPKRRAEDRTSRRSLLESDAAIQQQKAAVRKGEETMTRTIEEEDELTSEELARQAGELAKRLTHTMHAMRLQQPLNSADSETLKEIRALLEKLAGDDEEERAVESFVEAISRPEPPRSRSSSVWDNREDLHQLRRELNEIPREQALRQRPAPTTGREFADFITSQ
jgi:hypothetical protein